MVLDLKYTEILLYGEDIWALENKLSETWDWATVSVLSFFSMFICLIIGSFVGDKFISSTYEVIFMSSVYGGTLLLFWLFIYSMGRFTVLNQVDREMILAFLLAPPKVKEFLGTEYIVPIIDKSNSNWHSVTVNKLRS